MQTLCSVVIELGLHAFDKVLCPSRRSDDSVSHRLAQFIFGGTGILRDREVLGESVRAVDCHRAGHPDQFAGFDFEDFSEFVIENLVAGLHMSRLRSIGIPIFITGYACPAYPGKILSGCSRAGRQADRNFSGVAFGYSPAGLEKPYVRR